MDTRTAATSAQEPLLRACRGFRHKGMTVTHWAGADQSDTLVSDRYVVRALRQLG
jgi:hypothetical protein